MMTHEEQVLIRGKVFLYKQKAPFVPSGRSVFGALEYNEVADTVRCHECGEWFKRMSGHLPQSHGMSSLDYKIKHGLRRTCALQGVRVTNALSSAAKRTIPKRSTEERRQSIQKATEAARKANTGRRFVAAEIRNENNTCQAQILGRLKSLGERLGGTPSTADVLADGMSPASIRLVFNVKSLNDVYGLIGLAGRERGVGKNGLPGGNHIAYSKELLIEMLRDFYVKHARLPNNQDMRLKLIPDRAAFWRHFGSVHAAFEAAGLAKVAAA